MIRRTLPALCLAGALVASAALVPTAASAATRSRGAMTVAVQDTSTHKVTVRGWAIDPRKSSASIILHFYVSGRYVGRTVADNKSVAVKGHHSYKFTFTRRSAATVTARTRGVHWNGAPTTVGTHSVKHVKSTAASRIIAVAKRYVGKARYREGGGSPKSGFDCSGYTKYVYAVAHAGSLPHNANGQRVMKRMKRVSAAHARPGDLVFYQSGGHSFHVAIYAGHHKQYAAATPRDGIRYQPIWSRAVVYGHLV